MAVAKMSHIRLIGLNRDRNKIMNTLTANGLFEVRATDALPMEGNKSDSALCRELKLMQSEVAFALGFLKARHAEVEAVLRDNKSAVKHGPELPIDYTISKEKYSDARILITRADFSDAAAREYDLLHVCEQLRKISFDIVEMKSRAVEIDNTIAQYKPYDSAPVKLSDTVRRGDIVVSLYNGRASTQVVDILNGLQCAYELVRGNGMTIVTICRARHADEVDKQLSAAGYIKCTLTDDCTAEQKINALQAEKDDVKRNIFELNKKALEYEKELKDLRILYDVIGLDIERAEAEEKLLKTDSTFVLEGWLPERVAESTVESVKQTADVFVQLLAPEERDEPPTLVENNRVIKPYEDITNMYSPPKYREIDPNPIMSIFYFIFFGIMIGDACYGVILAVAGFVIGLSKKYDTGMRKLALLVGMGGISSIIWGVLFGSYFSINFGDGVNVAILLNPLDKPLLLLGLSIVCGVAQIMTGFIIKFVALCKQGKPFSAIFDSGSILLLFVALILLAVGSLPSLAPMLGIETSFIPPSWITTAAIVCALAGVALIVIFGGRNKKGVIGKIFGGLPGLYDLVNLLSDLLSYCRLFGLCLASCAIGMAFNSLGDILIGDGGFGYVIGGIVLAILHVFNLGLGVLSAYVHDARLQFLEFYSKFYEGGGRLFAPLGSNTKYIRYN